MFRECTDSARKLHFVKLCMLCFSTCEADVHTEKTSCCMHTHSMCVNESHVQTFLDPARTIKLANLFPSKSQWYNWSCDHKYNFCAIKYS